MTQLGLQWGLHFRWLKDCETSDTYREEVVDAWLKKQDNVQKRCPPTWRNLVSSLLKENQFGIAGEVASDHGMHILVF